MAKVYRNALRSKVMIRQAFIELLREKPLERITVVDIVGRSDLSRNTFYAHYQDVYAVLEEFQREALDSMSAALDEAVENRMFDDPEPFLRKIAEYIDADRDSFRVLLDAGRYDEFLARVKDMLIRRICENMDGTGIRDERGLLVFVEILAAGFVHLFEQYLRGESDLTSRDIVEETCRIFRAGMPIYRQ